MVMMPFCPSNKSQKMIWQPKSRRDIGNHCVTSGVGGWKIESNSCCKMIHMWFPWVWTVKCDLMNVNPQPNHMGPLVPSQPAGEEYEKELAKMKSVASKIVSWHILASAWLSQRIKNNSRFSLSVLSTCSFASWTIGLYDATKMVESNHSILYFFKVWLWCFIVGEWYM